MNRFGSAVLILLGMAIPAHGDWPEFRGPTGQGVATGAKIPTQWSDSENVAWKVPVPGVAWSSPVLVGNRIFLTTAVETAEDTKSYSLETLALDKSTGKTLWTRKLFHHAADVEIHSKNSHASPTPLVADGVVYVHYGPHGTAALTLEGEVIWTNNELTYSPQHGNGGSPALAGDVLVICCDGSDKQFVVGLDRKTGKVRWNVERAVKPSKGFSFSTPLLVTINGQLQAICPASDAVYSYAPETGEEVWRCRYAGGYSVVPRPVYAGGLVFICTGYNKAKLLAIDPTGTGDVTETHLRWQIDKGVPYNPSVVAVGEELYLVSDNGIATCADLQTGKVNWQERLGGNFSASLLAAGDHVYFQDEHGKAIVVRAGKTFEKVSENEFVKDERTFASYAVDGGALFIRSEKHLFRIEEGAKLQVSAN